MHKVRGLESQATRSEARQVPEIIILVCCYHCDFYSLPFGLRMPDKTAVACPYNIRGVAVFGL